MKKIPLTLRSIKRGRAQTQKNDVCLYWWWSVMENGASYFFFFFFLFEKKPRNHLVMVFQFGRASIVHGWPHHATRLPTVPRTRSEDYEEFHRITSPPLHSFFFFFTATFLSCWQLSGEIFNVTPIGRQSKQISIGQVRHEIPPSTLDVVIFIKTS